MGGYTKLFSSIVTSTIWREPDHVRLVWVTMLAMSDEFGVVEASVPGLADLARVTRSLCEDALRILSSPDDDSRTKDADGRRIEPCDGGWRLINHGKYRARMTEDDRRAKKAAYMRRYRDKSRNPVASTVTECNSVLPRVIEVPHQIRSEQNRTERESPPRILPHSLLAIWGRAKTAECGGTEWGSKAGISTEKARDVAEMISAGDDVADRIEPSMRAFWRDVKSKKNKDHAKIMASNAFAFGCWKDLFPAYCDEQVRSAPTEQKQQEESRRERPLARLPGA